MTDDQPPRRQRRRATAAQGPPRGADPSGVADAAKVAPTAEPKARKPRHSAQRAAARTERAQAEKAQAEKAQPEKGVATPPRRRSGPPRVSPIRDAERGLRDLVGSGPSQLGLSGALRARDVDRPSAEDLAAAERDVVIVRRNWQPPTDR